MSAPTERRRPGRWIALYAALLAVSHLVWLARDGELPTPPGAHALTLPERDGWDTTAREVRLVYRDAGPRAPAPVVILLHGNPGDGGNFHSLEALLAPRLRVVSPDLPGFGASTLRVVDYSIEAHAAYVLDAMDRLGIERAHLVGFSMGAGVALRAAQRAPERVASVVLLAGIGVQEMELFGSYELNHAVHAIQLAAIHGASALLPHFGALERSFFNVPYARNFYDTDQRPLRALLEAHAGPMLIVHGELDFLVSPATAREHQRIVPHSELVMRSDVGHFLLWTWTDGVAAAIADFVQRVEAGQAPRRSTAEVARVQRALEPFDPADVPPFHGPTLLVAMALLALATLVSEDLTCIGAGLLVAQGRISFGWAFLACYLGIFVGDLGLYLVGRVFGRRAVRHAPLSWWVKPEAVERASAWFAQRGGRVILLARLTPGMRLATYVTAGILQTRLTTFAFYFGLSGLVWTPMLVGFAAWAGADVARELVGRFALVGFVGLALVLLVVPRIVVPLFSYAGRRTLLGRWRRLVHFEFWPPLVFYAPVALYVCWLAIKNRGLGVVAAANPGIPTGGFVGESKSAILATFGDDERVARFTLIESAAPAAERRERALSFLRQHALDFPVVLKPDVGQRGSGVCIARDEPHLVELLDDLEVDSILQEYVDGPEFGIFYYRMPDEPHGRLLSITEKRLPLVVGDGRRTLEELILADDRAIAMVDTYLGANAGRLTLVPALGEEIELVQIGTHCRGAIFHDGARLATPELTAAIDDLSARAEGFYFGRYDVRVPPPSPGKGTGPRPQEGASIHGASDFGADALARGRGFKVIELNGVTSEATHIYDRRHGVLYAYRTLFRQWSLAFAVARLNLGRARPTTLRELWREWRRYRRLQVRHRRG